MEQDSTSNLSSVQKWTNRLMNNGMTTAETARATAPVVMLIRATGQTAASKLPLLNTLNVTI